MTIHFSKGFVNLYITGTTCEEIKLLINNCLIFFLFIPCSLNSLGPVVQSVVSLTSSLRVISLTVLADSVYNIMIFFAEKM